MRLRLWRSGVVILRCPNDRRGLARGPIARRYHTAVAPADGTHLLVLGRRTTMRPLAYDEDEVRPEGVGAFGVRASGRAYAHRRHRRARRHSQEVLGSDPGRAQATWFRAQPEGPWRRLLARPEPGHDHACRDRARAGRA